MNSISLESEKKYLEEVKVKISEYRNKLSYDFERVAEMYKGRYAEVKWGDEDLVAHQQKIIGSKLKKLYGLENRPYFGKLDYLDKDTNEDNTIYIGKTNVVDQNNEMVVTDWRTPVCSLFYEQNNNDVTYISPSGPITCDIINKYQIQIKDGKIVEILDSAMLTNDEILEVFLKENNEARLKSIVASIQSEQNEIIRRPFNANLIVQGVAGSGKTTVALHRAAYLLYINENYLADDYMIFGPNKYFLNYISALLPDLDTDSISQFTYEEFTKHYFNGKIDVFPYSYANDSLKIKILKFKSSLKYKKLLDEFFHDYVDEITSKNIMLEENILFSKEYLTGNINLDNISGSAANMQKVLINKVKNDREMLQEKFLDKNRAILNALDENNPLRKKIMDNNFKLIDILNTNCKEIISDYFKPLKLKPLDILRIFIERLDKIDGFDNDELETFKSITLNSIKTKKFYYEDLPSLLYVKSVMSNESNNDFSNYRQVIVDEGQDLGEFHYYMIKKMFNNSHFSIFGDLSQSIYPGRGIDKWEDVIKVMEFDNFQYLTLSKSYRTTKEITENANKVLERLNLPKANPVLRTGKEVETIKTSTIEEELKIINRLIDEYSKKDFKSFAIICKSYDECLELNKILHKHNINVRILSHDDEEFIGGLCLLSSDLSKGLEFDKVLLYNSNNYDMTSNEDLKLLYVASTRALHELTITYR